jgi:hypothetical protein
MALQSFVGPWPFFSFLILCTVGRTPWTGDQPVAMPLPTQRTTQTQKKRTQTSMLWVDPSVLATEDCLCPMLRGHCDRQNEELEMQNITGSISNLL